ncbi:MAG: sigma-54 dependent transcriptional regulator [Candidatus Aureabacteria bacterium]|nr:sigma-54 dependent transcriptional regulator [Candidatus Auribacterota bacterium]
MKPVILIVDDEKNAREGLERALQSPNRRILLAASAAKALDILERTPVTLVLTDLRMPGIDGLDMTRRLRRARPELTVILLTAYGTVQTAVEAMKEGAYDYLSKPINLDELEMVVQRAIDSRRMEREGGALRGGIDAIIGVSRGIKEIKARVQQVAPTKAAILIEGESGTGKELFARAIHDLSDRSARPFIAVHCAVLAEGVLESELFGHERGAFTGALKRHKGRFEMADKGTLFLDEVSEMAPATQVKLLRVLQEQEFERVGGAETIHVDVRLITATNANLEALIARGGFRDDLYYRLNVIRLKVPPLRDRKEDIPPLITAFLAEFNAANSKRVAGLTPEAFSAVLAYDWPGNVRELRNCVEGLVVLARGDMIALSELPSKVRESVSRISEAPPLARTAGERAGGIPREVRSDRTLKAVERRMIEEALAKTNGSKVEAAKLLGVSRRTLHRKIKRYGLSTTTGKIL